MKDNAVPSLTVLSNERVKGPVIEIAQAILQGFDKHYRLFRETSSGAKQRFERARWIEVREANRERIQMYDQRVQEAVGAVQEEHPEAETTESLWPRIKIAYIGMLHNHPQPELAETFFNSVACRVLHRSYFHNEYIFFRPAISTEHLEGDEPTFRCYYPGESGLRRALLTLVTDFKLSNRFHDLRVDIRRLERAFDSDFPDDLEAQSNYQLQALGSLFFRNKAAYIIGKVISGYDEFPFAIPILQNSTGEIFIDALLSDPQYLYTLFSHSRAYFMVDMEIPSAYVAFIHSILPHKPVLEIYNMLGLQKHGKTMFYRELHKHLRYSSDNFVISRGIRGMVMLVFTLPSFPFVFKIIRDSFEPPKDSTREEVKEKYMLVKFHDRVGRLADTLEYSQVALPLTRIDPKLMQELRNTAASNIDIEDDYLIIKHVYIERRMTPLNEFLAVASSDQREQAIDEYGNAIRNLAGANIFPGDMMLKNFGVTRHGRVVFYDYDEIVYMTECNFRHIPPARSIEEEMMDTPWYSVGPGDVFPEHFSAFFFSNPESRACFYKNHKDLVDPQFWIEKRDQILAEQQEDVFPYPDAQRFNYRFAPVSTLD